MSHEKIAQPQRILLHTPRETSLWKNGLCSDPCSPGNKNIGLCSCYNVYVGKIGDTENKLEADEVWVTPLCSVVRGRKQISMHGKKNVV